MTERIERRRPAGGFEAWRKLIERSAAILRDSLDGPWAKTPAGGERRARAAVAQVIGAGAALGLWRSQTAAVVKLTTRWDDAAGGEALTIETTADPPAAAGGETAYWAGFNTSDAAKQRGSEVPKPSADQIELARDAVASIARSAQAITHGPYDRWLAWRDAARLFTDPDDAERCATALLAGIKTIESWTKTGNPEGLCGLVAALQKTACTIRIEYENNTGGIASVGIAARPHRAGPAGTPTRTDRATYTSGPAPGPAVVELRRKSDDADWRAGTNPPGSIAIMLIEMRPRCRTVRPRLTKALEAITRHPEAATLDAITACAERTHPTIAHGAWIEGTTPTRRTR